MDDNLYQRLVDRLKTHPTLLIEGPDPTHDISYAWIQMNDELQLIEKGIPLFDFANKMQPRNFEMEYRLLRRLTESQHHNEKLKEYEPDLAKMNRYCNVLPFSHSEVKVNENHPCRQVGNTYVNANRLNTCLGDKGYLIATQGPLPRTFFNFYRMVLEQQVSYIVMLCQLQNGAQCDQYYPKHPDQPLLLHNAFVDGESIRVTFQKESAIQENLLERQFLVEMIRGDQVMETLVTRQINWLSWPDHGVPDQANYFFIEDIIHKMVESYLDDPTRKIVIHCSAGIGRTGTLLCLFDLTLSLCAQVAQLQEGKMSKGDCRLSVFGTVRRLREWRWGLLTSASQYNYIYNFTASFINKVLKRLKV